METSQHGQVTYKAEADALYPEGCTEGNNSGGACDWCRVYYDGPDAAAAIAQEVEDLRGQETMRRDTDEAMYRWAERYDDLNGAPESDEDR